MKQIITADGKHDTLLVMTILVFDPLDSQNVSNLKFKYPAFGILYGEITFIVSIELALVLFGDTDICIAKDLL